jgi:hypothetical protein
MRHEVDGNKRQIKKAKQKMPGKLITTRRKILSE